MPFVQGVMGQHKHIKATNWHFTSQLGFPNLLHCVCLRMSLKNISCEKKIPEIATECIYKCFHAVPTYKIWNRMIKDQIATLMRSRVSGCCFHWQVSRNSGVENEDRSTWVHSITYRTEWRFSTLLTKQRGVQNTCICKCSSTQIFICLNIVTLATNVQLMQGKNTDMVVTTSRSCQCIQFLFDSDFQRNTLLYVFK